MKGSIFLISLAFLLIISLFAISCPAKTQEVFELTFATAHPADDPYNSVMYPAWANWLEEASDGRIKMTLLPAGQAAATADHYDAARTGIVDIACQSIGGVSGRFPLSEVATLPAIFTFPDSRAASLALMALYDKYPELQAQHTDVKLLLLHASSTSQIHSVAEPIHTMEDLEGKVFITAGRVATDTLKALGGTPEAIAPVEGYDALAKGVVDGCTMNWQAMRIFNYTDVTNYSTEVSLNLSFSLHVMNLDTWNSLPADLQELFVGENAWRMAELYGYRFDQDSLEAKEVMNDLYLSRGYSEIYVLPEAERARWIEAVMPIWEDWVSSVTPEVGEDTARAILEDIIQFAEQYRYETTPFEECEQTLHEWGAPGY